MVGAPRFRSWRDRDGGGSTAIALETKREGHPPPSTHDPHIGSSARARCKKTQ